LKVAQRFIAGDEGRTIRDVCPVGTSERFNRPYGTFQGKTVEHGVPAVNCWAIVACPYGTNVGKDKT